ncbi:MAG: Type I restriction enzyme EcoR124II R protein [bacterium ADurb.Bin212]|nr:MAG: Type I restriction enzyme EcoR124II R protein [bacterium ADurb.Bin212]
MFSDVNFDEAKQSQLPFIELLINLGYKYIPADEVMRQRKDDATKFLLTEIAAKKLMEINGYEIDGVKYKFSEKDVRDSIEELERIQYEGLIDTAQNIFNIIMPTSGGKTIKINHGGKPMSKNFRFIDFEHPENNDFHVTAEYVAEGKSRIRPDIVCFVNGIPFAIIENKKSSVSVSEAINQMNRNQGPEYCPKLYSYSQLLVATNGKELQYGTTGTLPKFFAAWKEKGVSKEEIDSKVKAEIAKPISEETYNQILTDLNGATAGNKQRTDRLPTEQDRGVVNLFEPHRLLDLTKNYTLFDAGVKKLSRYQQYFAINKMLKRIDEVETTNAGITRRRGGLVWHTQGSGKSLTMVMFVKALIEDPRISNPRIIIVTDRKDLDKQIKDTFINCNLKKKVIQATSGQHLIDLIKEKNLGVITTLVHKFEKARKRNPGFVDRDQNIFVLIDEAHRTQSGIANFEMNLIIPNACYIGFTGTPLMKSEGESWRKFGGYIDKYTIDDALEDKIILPLIYEGRYVDLDQDEAQIDRQLERITADLNEKQKKELQRYIDTKVIKNNPKRILEISYDIEKHYQDNFQNSGLKAQIVAPSKYSAVLFQKLFEERAKIKTAIVISDEHEEGNDDDTHKYEVIKYLNSIREKHISVEKYERDVIESFKYNEDGIEIIIVVDKLLTGFDAPRNTVLYLTKDLHDHGLLQAIARVNRLFENKKIPKTYGYIIDYSENAKNIDTAMKLFGNYDEGDVKGTLIDVGEKIQELEQSYGMLHDVFKEVATSKDDEAYLRLLEDETKRKLFYESMNGFIKNINECFVLQDFVHEFKNIEVYKRELKKFMELRKAASLMYKERVDLSQYKQSLVNILDQYVDAHEVELLTKQVNITDREQFDEAIEKLGSDESKAEAIAAQTARTVEEKYDNDPEFYERFSKKINEVLQKMREGKLADIEALKQMKLIRDDVIQKKDESLPKAVKENKGADIFYRNLKDNFISISDENYINIISGLVTVIKNEAIIDWQKNVDVKRRMMNAIDDYLYDIVKGQLGIELSSNQTSEIISSAIKLAENNYEILAK